MDQAQVEVGSELVKRPFLITFIIVLKGLAIALGVPIMVSVTILKADQSPLFVLHTFAAVASAFVSGFGLFGLLKMKRGACDLLLGLIFVDSLLWVADGKLTVTYVIFKLFELTVLLVYRPKMED